MVFHQCRYRAENVALITVDGLARDVACNVSTAQNKVHLWLRQASYIKKLYKS